MPGYKIADIRKMAGLTQQQLAEKLGITQQSVQYYESGRSDIKSSVLVDMSKVLGVSVAQLLGMDGDFEVVEAKPYDARVRVYGRIPAGSSLEAIEIPDECAWCDPDIVGEHPRAFFLKVVGDSMDLAYRPGGMVLVDPDETEVVSGKCYAVLVNGSDATLKQLFVGGDTVILHPLSSNPQHRDRSIDTTDPDAPSFMVVGRVVWYVGPVE